jgi:hypothetical protein
MSVSVVVKAKRTDSWLGITEGKTYNAELVQGALGRKNARLMVHTDGWTVAFHEDDFIIVKEG